MKIHESLTVERVVNAADESMFGLESTGFCIHCGAEADGIEPDAEGYRCDQCHRSGVYGAEQLVIMITP